MSDRDLSERIEAFVNERDSLRIYAQKKIEQVKERNQRFKESDNVYDRIKDSETICETWDIDEFTDFLDCDKTLGILSKELWDDSEDYEENWNTENYSQNIMMCVKLTSDFNRLISELEDAMIEKEGKERRQKRNKNNGKTSHKSYDYVSCLFYSLMHKIRDEANRVLTSEPLK